ncbi:TetR/AcrR family transcriptional regulator [Kribbella turkmenica]|uniref:TetR/AcrR family transcriptional regulator n=1 Tax=Kribbella turkmenica TaxID=2530375 RepID=A0A4R4XDY6_9ACTN|nr:TetR/AcrR family transcriptional regulator [Kribbella turkmenica]TDD28652.1 TetR/AcrR family transcriptional regulator [Kribbella turkmenica]
MRTTQAERRARTRAAILKSAARGLSRYGYGNLKLEQVAADAGYTRGALYHLFKNKEELALAVREWVIATWDEEVGEAVRQESDPVTALLTLARRHAVYCRRDIARVAVALRMEFAGQDHPVGLQVEENYAQLVAMVTRLVRAGRRTGGLPAGAPAGVVASAYVGALEGTVTALAGQVPQDERFAVRAVAGVLGLEGER